jgi:hypothetical protein
MRSRRNRSRIGNAFEDVRVTLWLTRGAMRMRAGRAPWQSGPRRARALRSFMTGR